MSENKALDLKKFADELGFAVVFKSLGNNVRVRIPLSGRFCEQSIEDLDLSVRSRNALMRSGACDVQKVVDFIMSESGLLNIRNLGVKSMNEIKSTLLVKAYEELDDKEKFDFWKFVIEENNLK